MEAYTRFQENNTVWRAEQRAQEEKDRMFQQKEKEKLKEQEKGGAMGFLDP
jgi:hypothetical protein